MQRYIKNLPFIALLWPTTLARERPEGRAVNISSSAIEDQYNDYNRDPDVGIECRRFVGYPLASSADNTSFADASSAGKINSQCIMDDPKAPTNKKEGWPDLWDYCHTIRVAHWPGVLLSISQPSGWEYSMTRNQETNAFRRACQQTWEEAVAQRVAGVETPTVPTGDVYGKPLTMDDKYVRIYYSRQQGVDASKFPYALMSDIMYTMWKWVIVNKNNYDCHIAIHNAFTFPGAPAPERIGTINILNLYHYFDSSGNLINGTLRTNGTDSSNTVGSGNSNDTAGSGGPGFSGNNIPSANIQYINGDLPPSYTGQKPSFDGTQDGSSSNIQSKPTRLPELQGISGSNVVEISKKRR